jgi:2'-5' RNA ligase
VARLFIGLWPPQTIVDQLVALQGSEHAGVRYMTVANLHVTLRFFGEAEAQDVIAAVGDACLPAAHAVIRPM